MARIIWSRNRDPHFSSMVHLTRPQRTSRSLVPQTPHPHQCETPILEQFHDAVPKTTLTEPTWYKNTSSKHTSGHSSRLTQQKHL